MGSSSCEVQPPLDTYECVILQGGSGYCFPLVNTNREEVSRSADEMVGHFCYSAEDRAKWLKYRTDLENPSPQ